MKISTKGRYGLRALIDIACYGEDSPVPISAIAKRQRISERYLEQLVTLLKKAGLVQSVRGPGGGYILAKDMCAISAGDALRALEGNLHPVDCVAQDEEDSCEAAGGCVTKYVWRKINESINRTVDGIDIKELVEESRILQGADKAAHMKCIDGKE